MEIAIGSTNPVKVEAVRQVAQRVWPQAVVVGIPIADNLPAQPIGDTETRQGAIRRAKYARRATQADLGIGMEGGVVFERNGSAYLVGWCAVVSKSGVLSLAQGVRVPLPVSVAEQIRTGAELGPLMDRITGEQNTKEQFGAVGYFTRNLISRQLSFQLAFAGALAPFMRPDEYYPGKEQPEIEEANQSMPPEITPLDSSGNEGGYISPRMFRMPARRAKQPESTGEPQE